MQASSCNPNDAECLSVWAQSLTVQAALNKRVPLESQRIMELANKRFAAAAQVSFAL